MTQSTVFLYLFTTDRLNFVRLGVSVNPEKRLAELKPSSEVPLLLYAAVPLTSRNKALSVLERLQRKLISCRQGEWFENDPSLIKALAQTFAETDSRAERAQENTAQEKEWYEAGKSAFWLGVPILSYPKLGEVGSRLRSRSKLYWQEGWKYASFSQKEE